MPFLELWRRVHKEAEWKNAYQGDGTSTPMPYETFLPADLPHRDQIIEQLREQAAGIEL
jgi:hypothetical protein